MERLENSHLDLCVEACKRWCTECGGCVECHTLTETGTPVYLRDRLNTEIRRLGEHDRRLVATVQKLGLAESLVPIGMLDIAIFGTRASQKSREAFPLYHGNKELEFLGDRVLKLVHGEWIAEDRQAKRITRIGVVAQSLEMNKTFRRYLQQMGDVCTDIVDPGSKACANIFEAIVGSLYTTYNVGITNNAIHIVKHWLETKTHPLTAAPAGPMGGRECKKSRDREIG